MSFLFAGVLFQIRERIRWKSWVWLFWCWGSKCALPPKKNPGTVWLMRITWPKPQHYQIPLGASYGLPPTHYKIWNLVKVVNLVMYQHALKLFKLARIQRFQYHGRRKQNGKEMGQPWLQFTLLGKQHSKVTKRSRAYRKALTQPLGKPGKNYQHVNLMWINIPKL